VHAVGGGSAEDRNQFALDVTTAMIDAIGADRVGVRISPHGAFNTMGAFDGVDEQFTMLATELGSLGVIYLHLVNHQSMSAPALPAVPATDVRSRATHGMIVVAGTRSAATRIRVRNCCTEASTS